MGGAYKYIDPTPSKKFLDRASMLPMATAVQSRPWDERWGMGWGGAWYERGLALCIGAGGSAWGQLPHAWGSMAYPLPYALPFRRRRRRHSDKTLPLRGGSLSVGVPLADLTRQIPTNPDVYSKSHVGGHFQPDKAHLSAAFLRISPIPLRLLAFPHFAHFA